MVEGNRPPQPNQESKGKKPETPPTSETPKTTKRPSIWKTALELTREFGAELGGQGMDPETRKKYGFSEEGVLLVRQKIKNKLLEEKQKIFYISDQWIARKITEAATSFFGSRVNVEGKENLEKIHKRKKIYALNHLSNFDAPAFLQSLSTVDEKMKEKIIFLQGIKLDRNPAVKLLLMSFNRIKVWPASLPPKNEKEKHKRTTMTRDSLTSAKKALQENYNLAIYVEGGRSYNAKLKEGESPVTHFFELDPDTVIVPVSIYGTEKIMPVGRFWPSRHPATITFGEPIEAKSLIEMYKHLRSDKRHKAVIDYVMGKIAQNLPEGYRGVYADKV